jgi:iron-sulfur cluster insertion protein
MIKISSSALIQLGKISQLNQVKQLLFSVVGGGCNGFKYDIKPMHDNLIKNDEVIKLNNHLDLVIDGKSIFYIIGTEIDWKSDIMGNRFDFNNPNASSTCGCGTTFSVK